MCGEKCSDAPIYYVFAEGNEVVWNTASGERTAPVRLSARISGCRRHYLVARDSAVLEFYERYSRWNVFKRNVCGEMIFLWGIFWLN
ncbi:hypothetical protein AVEN_232327-1 [Araneus ventricosus]|uniref:Uncharacterized protein n=1 Tax=Araneus ventricosus TaxID=182803 RepID=A0A4Y2HJ92_ARAVE|nr:hypothetical protein AVEN_232327-1 [Araneus ventricosus]